MKEELKHLNCDIAANAEICHLGKKNISNQERRIELYSNAFLVASFFAILNDNEGEDFKLIFDDLPIYYVPEALKDKLYLMANLFAK